MKHIMIIDDDPAVSQELKLLLETVPYRVTCPQKLQALADQIRNVAPDLVLLDMGLPDESGLNVCARLRKDSDIPVIFVTAHNSSMDELNCLMRGGDDYITKPYEPAVLLAHIAAVLKRSNAAAPEKLIWRGVELDLAGGAISMPESGKDCCILSRNEVKILYYLMKSPGKIISRETLMDYLWEEQVYIDDNALSVNMTRLRGKLAEIGARDFISTRRGMGYQI